MPFWIGELDVHEADDLQRLRAACASARAAPPGSRRVKLYGGSEQPESPECTPACSTCSMMPPISTSSPSQHGVDVHFDGDVEEAVEQHRRCRSDTLHRVASCSAQVVLVEHDFHRAAAEHVGRAHDQRIADLARPARPPAPRCARVRFGGCLRPSFCTSCWKRSRSSAMSIESGEVPMIGTPAASSARDSLSGVWPPYCTITPFGLFLVDDLEHVLERQRLEVQAVRRCRSRSRRSPDCS